MAYREPAYAMFPTEEYVARVEKARALMDKRGIDALLLTAKENVVYFSGIRTIGWNSKHRPMGVVIPRNSSKPVTLIIPETLVDVSYHSSWVDDIRPWGGWRVAGADPDPLTGFQKACESLGVDTGKIGLELGYGERVGMSQDDFKELLNKLSGATFVDAGPLLWDLRIIKSPREVEMMRKVCDATDKAFARGFKALFAGMTERELGGEIMAELSTQTNELPGFIMVRSGEMKYGMVNVSPFEKPMQPGELVVVDVGGNFNYYWSDFMRMASIGEPSAEQKRFFAAELASQQAGVDAIKPGIPLHDIFDACYDKLMEHGMKEHVPGLERVGHGLGLDVHEPPSIGKGIEVIAQPGMILTVEPIFWDRPNHKIGNFALEDVVLVTETGHEVLSNFPKELYVVEA
ncbi:MAG TPA: Xaa-Pro peptidase family protein [Phototrophicaceae bacterium]|nr:Xaa-Pro peptidase family protein [Phototrophicaceae bacterium]